MNANEIIAHKASSEDEFKAIIDKAFHYALISLPFTVNRMRLKNLRSRILNIYKGKLAESLLENWALKNDFVLDFKSGESGFWTRDICDFKYKGIEWDLKNNFIHRSETLPKGEYLMLPALVPNRHPEDQWQSAKNSSNKGFVFSFISQQNFPDTSRVKLSGAQMDFIQGINPGEIDRDEMPFEEEWFFNELSKRGPEPEILHNMSPTLVITGYALSSHFTQFLDTDGIEHFNYAMFGGKWYELDSKSRLSFRNGLLRTRIRNATCPIQALPSFKSFLEASEK